MAIQSNFPAIKPSLMLDFASVKQLDPRITYTRASTATFYNGVTTAMAEQNLFTYSQEFDNAAWANGGTITTTANTATAPDGTTTADRLQLSAGNTFKYQNKSLVSGATYIVSVYVMSNTGGTQTFRLFGNDLSNSTADQTATTSWQRFTFSYTASSASSLAVGIRTDVANTAADLLVWGAQLEQRSAVSAYTATTTQAITNYIPVLQTAASGVARFDNNPTTGESLGLLIEESRTNLLSYSSEFDNAYWTKTQSTITANTIVAPDGTLTGEKLVEDTSNNVHSFNRPSNSGISITSAQVVSISLYAKAGERTTLYMEARGNIDNNGFFAYFNLSTGAVGSSGAIVSGTLSSTAITAVGNGWYRCVITGQCSAATAVRPEFRLCNTTSNSSYTGDGYSGTFVWGAQLEAGAFATSYIPTVASQVTRAADAASMTGTNFSSWYNQGEGSLYCESTANFTDSQRTVASINDASNSWIEISRVGSSSTVRSRVRVNGTNVNNAIVNSWTINTATKVITSYKVNDFAASLNAATVATGSTGALPLVNQFQIGQLTPSSGTTECWVGTIKKIAYYPLRVTNAQLQALTS